MIITDIFDKGGPVVWVLAAYSFIALTILFERLIRFTFMGSLPGQMEEKLVNALKNNAVADLLDTLRGPEATILQGLLKAHQEGVADLGRVASRIGSAQLQKMEQGFRTLAFLGNTAPLLGLLGTILGMIKAFMVIEQAGGRVDAQALAGGIWEAMLTTGVGLAVAIPILLLLHFLEGMADRRAQNMHNFASLMLEQLSYTSENNTTTAIHHRNGVIHAI